MDISDAKQNIDIVEIISQYVHLRKTGKDYTGLCPFHTEKTPSFKVSPSKQRFHCFGCGAGGDVIGFIQKLKGYDFLQACEDLGINTEREVHTRACRKIKASAEIKSRKRHAQRQERMIREVQSWVWWYEGVLLAIIEKLNDILPKITPDELEYFAGLIWKKSVWEHHLSVINNGTQDDWYELYAENRS